MPPPLTRQTALQLECLRARLASGLEAVAVLVDGEYQLPTLKSPPATSRALAWLALRSLRCVRACMRAVPSLQWRVLWRKLAKVEVLGGRSGRHGRAALQFCPRASGGRSRPCRMDGATKDIQAASGAAGKSILPNALRCSRWIELHVGTL